MMMMTTTTPSAVSVTAQVVKIPKYRCIKIGVNDDNLFGNYTFRTPGFQSFSTEMHDYTIISDFDLTSFLADHGSRTTVSALDSNGAVVFGGDRNGSSSLYDRIHETTNTTTATAQKRRRRQSSKTSVPKTAATAATIIPSEIREHMSEHWIHVAHIQPFSKSVITRNCLRDRVMGGQLLAYHYKECSIYGNRCVYYGFIPTMNMKFTKRRGKDASSAAVSASFTADNRRLHGGDGGNNNSNDADDNDDDDDNSVTDIALPSDFDHHVICRINAQHVWLRKLYVYMIKRSPCSCSAGCVRVSLLEREHVPRRCSAGKITSTADADLGENVKLSTKKAYCIKNTPWNQAYIMMGDADTEAVESFREHRECLICAQCRKCTVSSTFCRQHRVCKHKKKKISEADVLRSRESEAIKEDMVSAAATATTTTTTTADDDDEFLSYSKDNVRLYDGTPKIKKCRNVCT